LVRIITRWECFGSSVSFLPARRSSNFVLVGSGHRPPALWRSFSPNVDVSCAKVSSRLDPNRGRRRKTSMSSSSSSPCAGCTQLRRKCTQGCVFATYFPPDSPGKFANVHRVFGAKNVSTILRDLPPHQRGDAVASLAYEADARLRDPVYGCVSYITLLQCRAREVREEVASARKELVGYIGAGTVPPAPGRRAVRRRRAPAAADGRRRGGREGAARRDDAAGRARERRCGHAARCGGSARRRVRPLPAATGVAGPDGGGADVPDGIVSAAVVVYPVTARGSVVSAACGW
jgi:hypothetical protein